MVEATSGPLIRPLGALTVLLAMVVRMLSICRPRVATLCGSMRRRIAGFCWPPMVTRPTPSMREICCDRMLSAKSSTVWIGRVSEVSDRISTGESAGLTLRMVGALGRLVGSWPLAALIAACTSWAAASILRDRSNCRVTEVEPSELTEVSSLTPAISENCRSSGVATLEAMVSGLAPGRLPLTCRVGKSTSGRAATGRLKKATRPKTRKAAAISEVATGRRMKGLERLTRRASWRPG